jgi:hypothetical protein
MDDMRAKPCESDKLDAIEILLRRGWTIHGAKKWIENYKKFHRGKDEKMKKKYSVKCIICGKKVVNYKPIYCCHDRDCGCMGLPIEPPLCDNQLCYDSVYGKNNKIGKKK